MMNKTTSKDGTVIAYEKIGSGPVLILVDGALCYRDSGPARPLAKELADSFTVITYDRRGRGDSTNTLPYSVEKEVDDLETIIRDIDEDVYLYGISSGATLALEAANSGLPIKKLVMYEAPFITNNSRDPVPENYEELLETYVAANKRGAAVKLFMKKAVGLPAVIVFIMPLMPAWSKLKRVAHTLAYDAKILGDTISGKPLPKNRWNSATVETLVISGGKSESWIQTSAKELAEILPNARHQTLEKQTHMVKPGVLAPVLKKFFLSSGVKG